MAEGDLNARFFNYPIPTPLEQAYQTPPPAKNPVVKGAALNVLSNLVAAIPFVSYVLWSNAGFGDLRNCKEINSVEGRSDPTVIPTRQPSDELPQNHTNVSSLARAPPRDGQPRFYTIQDFHDAYRAGTITPTEVVEALLPIIRRDIKERGPHSTAFTETKLDLVRAAAEASTQRWKAGKPLGILDGVPFAVKDDLNVAGYKTHYGTKHDYTEGNPVETSWCVKKVEEQGAIMIGKLNMHELGADTTNNNPVWGTPLNPYNNSYYTGGSSGGVASAVGHGIVPFGIGSDGGGSIRIPSNYCGLYGLKPSHGRVSTAPMEAGEKSVVVRGPLATSMADLELSFRVLGQPDPSSFPSSHFRPPKQLTDDRPKVIGIFKQWFDIADPSVRNACQSAVDFMQSTLGYKVVDITIPLIGEGQTAHAMTILSEGVDIKRSVYSLTPANRILMSVAKQTPTIDFLLAQRVRNAIMEHLSHLFQTYPGLIIVTPTTPNAGWPIEKADLAYGMTNANMTIRNMEYVWLANFTGVPCIQFPVGYVPAAKGKGEIVPVGLSGHGEWGSDDHLIEFGYDGERFLREGVEGGKRMPEGWVDVLKAS